MSRTERDKLEELFQDHLSNLEVEVESDLLTPVQSRLRFDQYLKWLDIPIVAVGLLVMGALTLSTLEEINASDNSQQEFVAVIDQLENKVIESNLSLPEKASFQLDRVEVKKVRKQKSVHAEPQTQKQEPSSNSKTEVNETEKNETVQYGFVEASPVDGFQALYTYIGNALNYPDTLKPEKIIGTVQVGFVISASGDVINVTVKSTLHPLLDEEAMRVIREMPSWAPAKLNGKPMQSRLSIPITFDLEDITAPTENQ